MKPNLQSRLFWCLIIGTFTGSLSLTLPAAGAPDWIVQVLIAVNLTADAAALFLRNGDVKSSRRGTLPLGADGEHLAMGGNPRDSERVHSRRSPPPAENAAVAGDPATPARRQSFGGPPKPHTLKPKG